VTTKTGDQTPKSLLWHANVHPGGWPRERQWSATTGAATRGCDHRGSFAKELAMLPDKVDQIFTPLDHILTKDGLDCSGET
jgi:hypothetical protein